MKKLVPLFLLAVMLIAGCTGQSTGGDDKWQPRIVSFNASPSSISTGESSNLSWTVTGANTVNVDQGIGNVTLTGTRAIACRPFFNTNSIA